MGKMELGQRKDLERFYSHVTKYKSLTRVKGESGALTTVYDNDDIRPL